jgi:hypothetical protein
MRRSRLVLTLLVLALAASASALAGNGYRLYSAADQHPHPAAQFSVNGHGYAPVKALLYLYLDRKSCRSTWALEAKRVNAKTFKAGQSYFVSKKEPFLTYRTSGQFSKTFTAIAGKTGEVEYACAYLLRKNSRGRFTITADAAASHYTVTP